jgi:hypothetical protein
MELKLRASQVSIGDAFTKAGGFSRVVYAVDSFLEADGIPRHVRLLANAQNERMLVSISALLDPQIWLGVQPPQSTPRPGR